MRFSVTCAATIAWVMFILPGCYHLDREIPSSSEVIREPVDTEHRTVITDEFVEIVPEFDGYDLVLDAVHVSVCEDETVTTYTQKRTVERDVPTGFWQQAAGEVGAVAIGMLLYSYGRSSVEDGESRVLGTPKQERAYDKGVYYGRMGALLAVGGGALSLWSGHDLYNARDTTETLSAARDSEFSNRRRCSREPAADIDLRVGRDDAWTTVSTNSSGKAIVGLQETLLSGLPYADPHLTVKCNDCSEDAHISLPPALGARIVMSQDDTDGFWIFMRQLNASPQRLFEQRCAERVPAACRFLGLMIRDGLYTSHDEERYIDLHKRSCEYGSAAACRELAKFYRNQPFSNFHLEQALTYLQNACQAGSPESCDEQKSLAAEYDALNSATAKNTVDAYYDFLDEFVGGALRAKAHERLVARIIEQGLVEAADDYLDKYNDDPSARSAQEELEERLAEVALQNLKHRVRKSHRQYQKSGELGDLEEHIFTMRQLLRYGTKSGQLNPNTSAQIERQLQKLENQLRRVQRKSWPKRKRQALLTCGTAVAEFKKINTLLKQREIYPSEAQGMVLDASEIHHEAAAEGRSILREMRAQGEREKARLFRLALEEACRCKAHECW